MNKEAETAAARLWRDRAEIREQERNEALAQARLAEARCALLAGENEHLRLELASLRAFASLDPKRTKHRRSRRKWRPSKRRWSASSRPPNLTQIVLRPS